MESRKFDMATELPQRPRPGSANSVVVPKEMAPTNRKDGKIDRMNISDEDSDLLYDLACECEALFDVCIAELRSQLSAVAELLIEYQQRFAIWAAHLGVFARRSQSLDKRLENYPDIIDLTARLLDILRRSLAQGE